MKALLLALARRLRRFVGVPTLVRLDAGGCPSDVLDLAATWTRIDAALDNEIRMPAGSGRRPAAVSTMRG